MGRGKELWAATRAVLQYSFRKFAAEAIRSTNGCKAIPLNEERRSRVTIWIDAGRGSGRRRRPRGASLKCCTGTNMSAIRRYTSAIPLKIRPHLCLLLQTPRRKETKQSPATAAVLFFTPAERGFSLSMNR
jgi:hypothetical protein